MSAPAPPPAAGSAPKKRRYAPPPPVPNLAVAADLRVLHQSTNLSFVFVRRPTGEPSWHCQGTTVLFVVNESTEPANGTTNIALNLRGTCRVKDVQVETLVKDMNATSMGEPTKISLLPLSVSYQHIDPLTRVLTKPPQSYTEDDFMTDQTKYDADSQCSRGATGMTNSLRAASIASNMGELRISLADPTKKTTGQPRTLDLRQLHLSLQEAEGGWKNELLQTHTDNGIVALQLRNELHDRSIRTKNARIKLVARRLAEETVSTTLSKTTIPKDNTQAPLPTWEGIRVMKVTVQYEILNPTMQHLGGIHFLSKPTPHLYTTAGIIGDHEGPRSWIPCLDSASSRHRASHELTIKVTSPLRDGLFAVGCGEDFGISNTLLHDEIFHQTHEEELGSFHVNAVKEAFESNASEQGMEGSDGGTTPHVIPPDFSSIDSVLATSIWVSQVWTPTPARSLGFAIGPFKVLEDPEYFSTEEDEEDDPQGKSRQERQAFLASARQNGEGFRQVYFAPLYERKYIHIHADMRLLPNAEIALAPLGRRHLQMSDALDQTVIASTIGVPHRAISLLRDILALPAYRAVSYTQIWIPHAVHGGSTSGAMHCCPDVLVNPFLGGAIMDATLLPSIGYRFPYYNGGRVLQLLQARCAVRGWITAALPLGGRDDVGFGYIYTLFESFLMSIYERGHGAHGEGGAKGGVFYTRRYAAGCGLNSTNLDFLPVANIEEGELDVVVGGVVGAVPIEDRNNDQLWRTGTNGSESHTSGLDEFSVRQVLYKDSVDVLERGSDKDRFVPLPSMGWLGSHLSLSFLSSNASSSSEIGCGALELVHPVGGVVYRTLKCELLRRVVEGRAGVANFIRLIRASFIAAHLEDLGEKELVMKEQETKSKEREREKAKTDSKKEQSEPVAKLRPPFLVCVDELLKKNGLTHTLFTRALRILAGPIREPHLRGSLVDVERDVRNPRTNRQLVEPEGFPNSYIRGASELYLRVGVHVEPVGSLDGGLSSTHTPSGTVAAKGIQLHILAEPVIPEGGISFGGPITLRVVENEGQLREFVRTLSTDGSRCEWGPIFLHAKPVTTSRQQTAASGAIEGATSGTNIPSKEATSGGDEDEPHSTDSVTPKRLMGTTAADRVFTDTFLHGGGYQAIELVRLTNRTPLLWVRVDPVGIYGGRISIFQPDACLAEQLFHDGDAGAQLDAIRALAERPLRIQGSVRITAVYDVNVSELPVRVLGDCLRGSPALHSSLPHTPAVRIQAAYAIAQWQNNKAPANRDAVGADSWIGLNLLIQYFKERYYNDGIIMPVKFTRTVLKKNDAETAQNNANDSGTGNNKNDDDLYQYIDMIDEEEDKATVINEADEIEIEEDEEYRVRSAVVTAIASIRAQDGMTPPAVLDFLEAILASGDASMVGTLASQDEASIVGATRSNHEHGKADLCNDTVAALTFLPNMVVADALLALCHVSVCPALITDPTTGKFVQSKGKHPILPLMEACHRWLEWELYREAIKSEIELDTLTGLGGSVHTTIAACAITALSSIAILRQSTTDMVQDSQNGTQTADSANLPDIAASAQFYISIYDGEPHRADVTRAACAQAVACVCCAADRFEQEGVEPLGLLTALEFLLDRILETSTSPGLRQTLALLMLDSCTGKVCSMQRVGSIGGRGDLCSAAARFLTGPLGASYGGDNGSALLTAVTEASYPAASAVNDGARRGLRLLSRAGHPRDETIDLTYVRVAKFATSLWRTVNGDRTPFLASAKMSYASARGSDGVCANDAYLRCTLLSLWQWIWPKGCFAVLRVQAWRSLEGTQRYKDLGADLVMKITDAEKEAASTEDASLAEINSIVLTELDRQQWRGEMALKAYSYYKDEKKGMPVVKDVTGATEQGIGQPLPPVHRDNAFKQGGWIASTAQQRRVMTLDGGTAVTKIRLTVKGSGGD